MTPESDDLVKLAREIGVYTSIFDGIRKFHFDENQLATWSSRIAAQKAADVDALLPGIESLLREAYEHWDADREFKVGKILLAFIGHNKGYDKRSDAFRDALAAASPAEPEAK